jgi:hypothetical protein
MSMQVTVWTRGYRPFIMGGNVNADLKADVECDGPFDLGKGYSGYVFQAGKKWFVAESESGGIVGNGATQEEALKSVIDDVRVADEAFMEQQIKDACARREKAAMQNTEYFLSIMAKAR